MKQADSLLREQSILPANHVFFRLGSGIILPGQKCVHEIGCDDSKLDDSFKSLIEFTTLSFEGGVQLIYWHDAPVLLPKLF